MSDATGIAAALASLKAATDIVRALRTADVSFERAELKMTIADLADSLVTARLAVVEAQEDLHRLRDEVASLRRAKDLGESLTFRDGKYYLRDNGNTDVGPYCSRCYEVDAKLVSLRSTPFPLRKMGKFQCPNCDKYFE